jgi:hypothetical protein
VGGNGAIDRLGFPDSCGVPRSIEELEALATRLLKEPEFYGATVKGLIPAAGKDLGFEIVAKQLGAFFR